MRPIPSHLDRTSLVNKRFIRWHKEHWKKLSLYLFVFEHWKGKHLDAKVMARAPISWLDKCRKYSHLIGYISNSNFKLKFSNSKQTFVPVFVAKRIFKAHQHFAFFVFILVDAFSGSIKTEKTQKIFLPWQKIISAKENFRALAWTLAKFYLREPNRQSRAGRVAPSCFCNGLIV